MCSGFDHIQCDCTCACAVACFHTCVDQMQTHTQTTYTAQTHHTSTPTVVGSLMIHDTMYVDIYIYIYIYIYISVFIYVYVHVHVYMCVVCCFFRPVRTRQMVN